MNDTSLPDDLVDRIEATRITYPEVNGGVTIEGSAFVCNLDVEVNPESFCDELSDPDEPWRMFGISTPISEGYWKLHGVMIHDDSTSSSKITLEVAPEWVRIYVKEDCSAERAAELVRTLDEEYGVDVEFADQEVETA